MASMGPRRAARSLPCLQNGACAVPSPRKEPGRSRRPPGTAGSWAFEPEISGCPLLLLSILEDQITGLSCLTHMTHMQVATCANDQILQSGTGCHVSGCTNRGERPLTERRTSSSLGLRATDSSDFGSNK